MEDTTLNHATSTTFPRREKRIKQDQSEMGLHQSFNGFHRRRYSSIHRSLRRKPRTAKSDQKNEGGGCEDDDDDDDDEKEGIERRIVALQRIIPGGESLGIDKLFEETAGYIMALQGQVKAMKVLTSFIEELQKENMKLGG
ncbi:hypothetical protein HHK36_005044 [Tetracentron sinense]|uniref:Uncharacterized protein n=1 Tax=Tetracentron sinense TaxID=13715 RepID=A0A834ZK57_TETSI|nr:hypothetical protein HHK36_005044 [Tetracentron sinense]